MGAVMAVIVLYIILLYLIIVASDETRRTRSNRKSIFSRIKNNIYFKIFKLWCKEVNKNYELTQIKADLRIEHEEYSIFKYNTYRFLKHILANLINIDEVNRMNIEEIDKRERIRLDINSLSKECAEFIVKNELDT